MDWRREMKYIKKAKCRLRRWLFLLQFNIVMYSISRIDDNPFTFPVIINMEFNRQSYYRKWLKGESFETMIKDELETIENTILSHTDPNRLPPDIVKQISEAEEFSNQIEEDENRQE